MKSKLLLFYGYILPIVSSAVVSSLPWFFGYDYKDIALYYSGKQELLIAFFVAIVAIAVPFQTTIVNEDNADILEVLRSTKVREVFVFASTFQAILISGMLLLTLFLASFQNQNATIGYIQLFASSLITDRKSVV